MRVVKWYPVKEYSLKQREINLLKDFISKLELPEHYLEQYIKRKNERL